MSRTRYRDALEFGVFVSDGDGSDNGRSMRLYDAGREYGRRAAVEQDPERRDRYERWAREISAVTKGMLPEDLRRPFGEMVNVQGRTEAERWLEDEDLRRDDYKPHRPTSWRPPGPPVATLPASAHREEPEREDAPEPDQLGLFRE